MLSAKQKNIFWKQKNALNILRDKKNFFSIKHYKIEIKMHAFQSKITI